ncbi:MAG: hypothetical protein QGI45_01435 [Myxococcota bacterium]|nr:hypothetical protein [Myxococcota bacterium]
MRLCVVSLFVIVFSALPAMAQKGIFSAGTQCVLEKEVKAHHKPRAKKVKIDTLSAGTQITVDKKFKVWVRVKIGDEIRFIRPAPFKALCKIQAPETEPKAKEEAEPAPETQAPSDAPGDNLPEENPPTPQEQPASATEKSDAKKVEEPSNQGTPNTASTTAEAPEQTSSPAPVASVDIPAEPAQEAPQIISASQISPATDESVEAEPQETIVSPQAAPDTASVPLETLVPEEMTVTLEPECQCPQALPKNARDGGYFGLGFGLGGADFLKAALANGSALQVNMRFGYAFSNQWLLGMRMQLINQFSQWKENKPFSAGISTILLDTQIFPMADLGFSIELGGGWTSVAKFKRLADIDKTTLPTISSLTGEGPAYAFTLGYDFESETNAVFGLSARYDGAAPKDINPIHGGSLNFSLNWY